MTSLRRGVPDWGQTAHPGPSRRGRLALAGVFGLPILVLLATAALGVPLLAAVALSALYAVGLGVWVRTQGRLALAAAGARRMTPGEQPRLANVVAGIASDLGMAAPELWLVERGGPNALACRSKGPVLAVTTSLLDSFTRTELEAVVAHCLVRLAEGQVAAAQLSLALGRFGLSSLRAVGAHEDAAAAAVTRYPPALAQALAKSEPAGGRYAPLWFADDDPWHEPATERAASLREL